MKQQIKVHGYVQDNSGTYHQAGDVLTIDDEGGEGCITADAADQLVTINSAEPFVAEKAPTAK